IYFSENDSRVGTSRRDTITDFNRFADRIELGRLDADTTRGGNQAFDFIGTATFSGTAGELRFFQSAANGFTLLQADTDGDGVQEFQIELTGMITLTEDNFTL
ncbi:MAG: M10 family metallopeptidase C-terminal domain-containing protein, partial [Pseudomonadota bacterium]